VADFFSLTIKEEFLLEVFFLKLQKLLSTKVCAVELSLLDEESFLEQELIVKTISRERIMGICLK
jgi:hypothetical protein